MSTFVTSLKHVALTVPDPAEGRDFYQAFGLEAQERSDKVAMRCYGRDQDQIVMLEGPEKRIHHYSFTATPEGLEQVRQRVQARGITVFDEAPDGADDGGIWFQDFENMWVNVMAMDPATPVSYEHVPEVNVGGRYPRVDIPAWRSAPKEPRPRRLGHSPMLTDDYRTHCYAFGPGSWFWKNSSGCGGPQRATGASLSSQSLASQALVI